MAARRKALAQRRIHVGLTQEQLADALDMDVSAIKRWELGVATPHPNIRRQLAQVLELSLEEVTALLEGKEPSTGIVHLSTGHETRINEYKQCLLAAQGDILVSGTSLVHITDDSRGLLADKLRSSTVRILILDPDWIGEHGELLTFLPTKRARQRFRHEIDASLDRLSYRAKAAVRPPERHLAVRFARPRTSACSG